MAWWSGTVTATNGSANVTIVSGDPIDNLVSGNALIIGSSFNPVEIKRAYFNGTNNIIELVSAWPNATQTSQPAKSFTTDADLIPISKTLATYLSSFTKASQTDAVTGTDNTNVMTALRTKEAIQALVKSAAYLDATTSRVDHTLGRSSQIGDMGIGNYLDFRVRYSDYDTPQKCYSKGTLFGFIDGASIGIPNYSNYDYGVLTIHGQYNDYSGAKGTCQEFRYGADVWIRAFATATTWTPWTKLLKYGEQGFGTNIVGIKDVMAAWNPSTVLANLNSTGSDCHYQGMIQNHGSYAPEAWGTLSGFVSSGNNYSYTWQEFIGHSSTKWRRNATGSTTWTEWRKVLEKSDFGIGGTGGAYTRCDNANTLTGTGHYWTASEWQGSPVNGQDGRNQGYLIHQDWGTDSSYALQEFYSVNGTNLERMVRRKDFGTWTRWYAEGELHKSGSSSRALPKTDWSTNVDLNTLNGAGWWHLLGNPTNSSNFPPHAQGATAWWFIQNIVYAEGAVVQQYAYSYMTCDANGNPSNSYIFVRVWYGGSGIWSKWQKIAGPDTGFVYYDAATDKNIGAIIERGSNANGEYVKFADGTMICTHSYVENADINIQEGALYRSATISWTFPASFGAGPSPCVWGTHYASGAWVNPRLVSYGSTTFVLLCNVSFLSDNFPVHLVAIGRWR